MNQQDRQQRRRGGAATRCRDREGRTTTALRQAAEQGAVRGKQPRGTPGPRATWNKTVVTRCQGSRARLPTHRHRSTGAPIVDTPLRLSGAAVPAVELPETHRRNVSLIAPGIVLRPPELPECIVYRQTVLCFPHRILCSRPVLVRHLVKHSVNVLNSVRLRLRGPWPIHNKDHEPPL